MSSVAGDRGFATRFAVAALATWRVTHLVTREDGPAGAVASLRARAGSGALGELMDCFYCSSMWAALPFGVAIARRRSEAAATSLALSGAACLLERLVPDDVGDESVTPGGQGL